MILGSFRDSRLSTTYTRYSHRRGVSCVPVVNAAELERETASQLPVREPGTRCQWQRRHPSVALLLRYSSRILLLPSTYSRTPSLPPSLTSSPALRTRLQNPGARAIRSSPSCLTLCSRWSTRTRARGGCLDLKAGLTHKPAINEPFIFASCKPRSHQVRRVLQVLPVTPSSVPVKGSRSAIHASSIKRPGVGPNGS